MITVLVPVLGRPTRAAPLVESARSTAAHAVEIVFICSPSDHDEQHACSETDATVLIASWEPAAGDYARKMNFGYRQTSQPFLLLAADDVRFHPGWDHAALAVAEHTGAAVIGTNDMGNPHVHRQKLFSTHPLVRRSYIDEQGASLDGPGVLCHEGYDHNFVDRELWDIALNRGLTAFAPNAKIEHLHPHWRKGQMDATYEKGLKNFHADQRLYWTRCEQWGKQISPREQQELARWSRRMAKGKT